MRALILSRKPSLYSTRRLVEAFEAQGREAVVLDPLACWLACGRNDPAVYHGASARRVDDIDVVIPRVGPGAAEHGLSVVRQFGVMGVPVLNAAHAIARSRDKLRSLQFLSQHDVDIPTTVMVRSPDQMPAALRCCAGPPVVLKLPRGTQGIGVMLAETQAAVESILHTVWSLGHDLIVQEFIAESRGRDIRALVVGGRVVASMRRVAPIGEFRSNIHRGAAGTAIDLPDTYAEVAIEATRIMGLDVAGVDMLESSSGPKVVEINSSPGFEGLERATGIDVAGAIVAHAATLAAARVHA
ncbi:MAG TPA: RimK family alpha-L-glutamate ligase [Candidatus Polarisedimenticolaceae bacterium]|nr:RimK family alpha-L-glutamate ligase [Candidatus Polarisedimenticolaceae bacterium]